MKSHLSVNMMNIWSLKRFSSVTGSTITSSSNGIGYFAYSMNLKIIVFDINLMIDGNNGNIMLRSNTFNRLVIDIQNGIRNVKPWTDYLKMGAPRDHGTAPNVPFNVRVKSVFVNDLHWGPYIQGRWSFLFSCLNNGVVHLWLVPNIDSFSLAPYSPTPCFELLDLLYTSLTDSASGEVAEFDWDTMMTVKGSISQAFCSDLMLNTDTPTVHSCVFSVQKTELPLQRKGVFLFSACWNEFIALYAMKVCEIPSESCKETTGRILSPEQQDLSVFLPILPKVSCRPLVLTQIPSKEAGEIVTSCLITDFRHSGKELFFEIYVGSSQGKIYLFRFSFLEESESISFLGQDLIHKSCPSVPITQVCYKPVSKTGSEYQQLFLASEGTKVVLGRVGIGKMSCEILQQNNPSFDLIHQMPIKSVKCMEDLVYNEELLETAFLTVDQGGLGLLHIVDLEAKIFNSIRVLTMNKLSTAPSVFPNLDQALDSHPKNDSEGSSQSSSKNFYLESLQNVPPSIKSIKDSNNDFRLIAFENPLVPGQTHSFRRKDIHQFSVAVISSAALNTIRLVVVFNGFSPMDHICNRISSHFIHTESLISAYSDLNDKECLENLSRAISRAFTLNDIRLVLAGPLTTNKVPILDETEDKSSKDNEDRTQSGEANVDSSVESATNKVSSFLNFKLGKKFRLKVEDHRFASKDENSDEVLDVFLSLFYESVSPELVKDAISYNLIDEEFPKEYTQFFQISRPVLSNLVILVFCYIAELEPFIPKSLEYAVSCRDKSSSFETLSRTLGQAASTFGLPRPSGSGKPDLNKNSILALLFMTMYSLKILNSLRCLAVLLYSRSSETVDSFIIRREELMSGYIIKLQYYIQQQITRMYSLEVLGPRPGLIVSASTEYIWSRIKNSEPIHLSQICQSDQYMRDYFSELADNSCCLVSEPPYNLYTCSNNHSMEPVSTSVSNAPSSSSDSNIKDNCVCSVPICPVTFLPVNVFAMHKHLSCNSCGRVVFIPIEMTGKLCMKDRKCMSSQISVFEKTCLQGGYHTCQFCLNVTELLDI